MAAIPDEGMETGEVLRMISAAGRDDMQQGEPQQEMAPQGPPPEAMLPPSVQALMKHNPVSEGEAALALLNALRRAGELGAATGDARVAKDAAAAAVGFAEAMAKLATPIVDPRELATIEHQTRLEQAQIQGELQVDMAKVQTAGSLEVARLREEQQERQAQRQQQPKVDPESVSQ